MVLEKAHEYGLSKMVVCNDVSNTMTGMSMENDSLIIFQSNEVFDEVVACAIMKACFPCHPLSLQCASRSLVRVCIVVQEID